MVTGISCWALDSCWYFLVGPRWLLVAATRAPVERVYVRVTPLGSLERGIAMWENKQKEVGRHFVAFCPNNGMQHPLN